MSEAWDIKQRSDCCSGTGEGFLDGQSVFSCLVHNEEGYVRLDYSEQGWAQAEPASFISIWKGVYVMAPPPKAEPVEKKSAESLLRRLMEDETPENRNTIYILAVMLERKRIFIEREVQQDKEGTKLRVYEHRETGETFIIPDPELKLSEIQEVQEEVIVMLGGQPPGQREPDEADEDEGDEDEDNE